MVNIKDTVKKLQKKLSPKKSKSPRHVICKVKNPPNNDMIYIIYVKLTNHLPITRSENDGLSKYDFAGVFTTEKDAKYVVKCLNKIFSWFQNYNNDYKLKRKYRTYHWRSRNAGLFSVDGFYRMMGDVAPEEFIQEIVIDIAKDKQILNRIVTYNATHVRNYVHTITDNPLVRAKIHQDPQLHVKRYRTNDVMPTMNLDDYDLEKHHERLKIISEELQKYPHKKTMDRVIDDLEYSFPTHALKTGGIQYQNLTSDPDFRRRWAL